MNNIGFTGQNVPVDDYMVYTRSNNRKSAKTIILVPGIGVSERYFRPFAEYLANNYNVVSINLPGWARTKKPSRALDLDELATILARFIVQQQIAKPILIGQSMGCQIVVHLSAKQQVEIDKIILLGPTINKYERTRPLQLLRLMQDGLREPFAVNWILLTDYIKFGALRYLATQNYMMRDKIEETIIQCSQQALIVRGTRDKIVPKKWVEFLASKTMKASVKEVTGQPHNLQFTRPEELTRICMEFIER